MMRVKDKKNYAIAKWKQMNRNHGHSHGADSDRLEDDFAQEVWANEGNDERLKEFTQTVRDGNNIIKLQVQKIDGIDPLFFNKKDIVVSFFNGKEPELTEVLDSDDSDYV